MKERWFPFFKILRDFSPLKKYFLENRWRLTLGLFSLLMVDFAQLLIPLVIKKAVDSLTLQSATLLLLFRQACIIMFLAFLIAALRYVWRHLLFGHSRKVEERLRNRLYRRIQELPVSFFHKTRTGDLMARAVNDINAVRMATGMGLVALTDGVILGLTAIGFMLSINLKLALISLIPAPLIILFTKALTRRMSTGFEQVQGTFSDLTERVREAFAGIRVLKAYNREDWEYERVKVEGRRYVQDNMALARTLAFFFPLMAVFTNMGLGIVIWLGGRLTILGDITTGDFVAFTSYLNLLNWPLMAMGWVTNLVQRGSASMRRINRILQEPVENLPASGQLSGFRIHGKISIRGLSFRYPPSNRRILSQIRLEVHGGETVALVGRVGAGKSTLLQCIPRLLDVPPRKIFIDQRDVCEIHSDVLRKNVGFVTQEVFLFTDTIRNNVVLGREGIPDDRVVWALRASGIYEEVQELDSGLDTVLGEQGVTLSGGQRQRLTIARALLLDPPILILDDALSMVDIHTEEGILDRLLSFRHDKTNLIVSHRVSTVSRADRIVVLEQGKIVEEGSHKELLESGSLYPRLYEKQILAQKLEVEIQ